MLPKIFDFKKQERVIHILGEKLFIESVSKCSHMLLNKQQTNTSKQLLYSKK